MKIKLLISLCLPLIFVLVQCAQKEDQGTLYREADSLLNLVIDLQNKIGSPEIQRLNEFEDELNEDISLLASYRDEDTSLVRYLDLYNGLGQCMDACNQFHEEAFLLESSLRDILEGIGQEESDQDKLSRMILFEGANLEDLSRRVDSSLEIIMNQVKMFYRLKPEIESLKLLKENDSLQE